ncbi:MAG TPA: condensation domain-containing protein, partial [Rhodocyclaceae bacterium]|nr:condensation domain-containing protein [Rhodocyclaceae bacterium]
WSAMFTLKKFNTQCEKLSFQEIRDLAWGLANPDICFNTSRSLLVDGKLDKAVLISATLELAQTHEALRTSFLMLGRNTFKRKIKPLAEVPLEVIDRPQISAADPEATDIVRRFSETKFEATDCPLFRMQILYLKGGQSILTMSVAHVVSDGASLDVLLRDLGMAYAQHAKGMKDSLPKKPFGLSDFVRSHREWMESDDYLRRLGKIRTKLEPGIGNLAEIAYSCGIDKQVARKAAVLAHRFPNVAYNKLAEIAQANRVTMSSAMMAMAALTLARMLKKRVFFISFMFSNRQYEGIDSMVGHIANAVPMFVDTVAHGTVSDFVKATSKAFYLSTSSFGLVPLGAINSALAGLDPVLSLRSPFNMYMINISPSSSPTTEFSGMAARSYSTGYAGYIANDLQLNYVDSGMDIQQSCRCPEEQMGNLGQTSIHTFEAALDFALMDNNAPLAAFFE